MQYGRGRGCGCVMYCTVRYAFVDLIDKNVATKQQMGGVIYGCM